jgi:hypothetical protein
MHKVVLAFKKLSNSARKSQTHHNRLHVKNIANKFSGYLNTSTGGGVNERKVAHWIMFYAFLAQIFGCCNRDGAI